MEHERQYIPGEYVPLSAQANLTGKMNAIEGQPNLLERLVTHNEQLASTRAILQVILDRIQGPQPERKQDGADCMPSQVCIEAEMARAIETAMNINILANRIVNLL